MYSDGFRTHFLGHQIEPSGRTTSGCRRFYVGARHDAREMLTQHRFEVVCLSSVDEDVEMWKDMISAISTSLSVFI